MSTAMAKTNGQISKSSDPLRSWFAGPGVQDGIASALGGYMDAGAFINQMLIAFRADGIVDCTPQSKFEAAHQCAALGLLPSLNQVALIPRNIKDKGLCCTVMPQWQGYQALMLRHPDVQSVKAVLVHAKDSYTVDPETEAIRHSFDPFDPSRTWNDIADVRGGYLVVKYKDGRQPLYHYVTADTIRKARACSQKPRNPCTPWIWDAWFEQQCLKTIYRNAYARRVVPIDHLVHSRLQELVEADDVVLENDPGRVVVIDPPPVISHKPSRAEIASQRMTRATKLDVVREIDERQQAEADESESHEAEETSAEPVATPAAEDGRPSLFDEAMQTMAGIDDPEHLKAVGETLKERESECTEDELKRLRSFYKKRLKELSQ